MQYFWTTITLAILQLSCSDRGIGPEDRHFNVHLKYGILARNELNTFNNTFTKDLILDGTITTNLIFSPRELASIESTLVSIDIFSYPDTFVVNHGDTLGVVTPHSSYILTLKLDSIWKNLHWADSIVYPSNTLAQKLREAFDFIRKIIEARSEYQNLPEPRGGYL